MCVANLLIVFSDDVRRTQIPTMVKARGRDTFKAASYASTWDMRGMLTVDS
ncbi:MAG: hypothetical protein ACYS4W_09400 [Planctomycetota bacterium]|jgi:hypothetical protein